MVQLAVYIVAFVIVCMAGFAVLGLACLALGGIVGWLETPTSWHRRDPKWPQSNKPMTRGERLGMIGWYAFFGVLVVAWVWARWAGVP